MSRASDLDRLRAEYTRRGRRFANSNRYTASSQSDQFILSRRRAALGTMLEKHGFDRTPRPRILDVGCGRGGVLAEFTGTVGESGQLHGTDLLPQRVHDAHSRFPLLHLSCADAQNLPYATGSFDLVLQFTVFSSVLDADIRLNLAREILRVMSPTGLIVWYDFWLNPTNRQTRGIRPAEIRRLFPGCRFDFRRITLAPPLARIVVPVSWTLAALLEKLVVFNSHYLVAIRKPMSTGA